MTTIEQLRGRIQTRRELPAPAVRRALRQAAGVSQSEIAQVAGVTRQAVALWEVGQRTPRGPHLDSYVGVLRTLSKEIAKR